MPKDELKESQIWKNLRQLVRTDEEWESLKWFLEQHLTQKRDCLATLDPVNEPTKIARAQGAISMVNEIVGELEARGDGGKRDQFRTLGIIKV